MSEQNAEDRETVAAARAVRERLRPGGWHPSEYDDGTPLCEGWYDKISRAAADAVLAALDVPALRAENERLRLRVETADAYIDGKLWDSNVADCAAKLDAMTVERNALAAQVEKVRALPAEWEAAAYQESQDRKDALHECAHALRAALDETGSTT